MAAISHMTFSSVFHRMKTIEWKAIIWTNVGMLYWCIYASLSLNELIDSATKKSDWKYVVLYHLIM